MAKTDDYGGGRYGSRYRNKPNEVDSHRCDDCGKLAYLHPRELARAAKPHCKNCGSTRLVETESNLKRKGLNKPTPVRRKKRRCPGCGCLILNNEDCSKHLSMTPACLSYVQDNREPLPGKIKVKFGGKWTTRERWFIPMTIHLERVSTVKWKVKGLDEHGQHVEVIFGRQYEAKEWIQENFGPVELAR